MSATRSRREMVRDCLMYEFGHISKETGYRTDVKKVWRKNLFPDEATDRPCVVLYMKDEPIQQVDQNRTLFNSEIPVVVLGYFSGDLEDNDVTPGEIQGEALFHDLKRVVGSLILKYVNDTDNPWHVMGKDIQTFAPILEGDKRRGECRIEFTAQVQRMDVNF